MGRGEPVAGGRGVCCAGSAVVVRQGGGAPARAGRIDGDREGASVVAR
jgi:hypothetical protein